VGVVGVVGVVGRGGLNGDSAQRTLWLSECDSSGRRRPPLPPLCPSRQIEDACAASLRVRVGENIVALGRGPCSALAGCGSVRTVSSASVSYGQGRGSEEVRKTKWLKKQ